jgi:dipeptidyl aminopeptidase/acylaminoacyl peptidase
MARDWRERFTAPSIEEFRWAADVPSRLAVVSNESGSSQAWAWDLETGARRQASSGGVGAEEAHILPDGSGVVWWLDALGDERGRWMLTPFDGGEAAPLLPDVADAWMAGISLRGRHVAAGFSTDDAYEIRTGVVGGPSRLLYRHARPAGVGTEYPQGAGGLSADAALVAIRHAERSDIVHPAVRVVDAATGEERGEIVDEGRIVTPAGWSPVPGDQRLVVQRETREFLEPWLWDLAAEGIAQLGTGLAGDVTLADWYPRADALLLHQDREGRHALHRLDLRSGERIEVVPPTGTISQAGVRPDGEIWFLLGSGEQPPRVRGLPEDPPLVIGASAPPGRPFSRITFPGAAGAATDGFVVTPPGEGPFPTVVSVHGGPEWHHTDDFDPETQAFVDEGWAVVLVNYRGSTGHGVTHREALHANVGFPESEDIVAAVDHAVAAGVADPARIFLAGWSWGGYLATLNAGINPDRWRAVFAGIPVGDSVAAHYECAPALRAWDLAVMGGSPEELPELYTERNPLTYVDRVRAPMLVIAGEHDSRCPIGQVMTYVVRLRARGHPVEVHLYPEGHHTNDAAGQVRHTELVVEFFLRHR